MTDKSEFVYMLQRECQHRSNTSLPNFYEHCLYVICIKTVTKIQNEL